MREGVHVGNTRWILYVYLDVSQANARSDQMCEDGHFPEKIVCLG